MRPIPTDPPPCRNVCGANEVAGSAAPPLAASTAMSSTSKIPISAIISTASSLAPMSVVR